MNINKLIQLVLENYQAGNLQHAEQICRKILKEQPKNFDALHFLGVICSDLGDYNSGISYIKKAIQIDPNFSNTYNNLGNIFQQLRQLDEAISCYKKALKLNPGLAKTYYNLGVALQDKGDLKEAITSYKKAMQLSLTTSGLYINLGLALEKEGQLDEAITCYQRALQIDPNSVYAYNNLGLVLQGKGQLDEAITCYQKALQIDPNFADAHFNLGKVLQGNGQLDEAITCYQKALQIDPNFADAYGGMGDVFIVQGKLNEGICCFKKVLQLKPNSPGALLNLVEKQRLSYDDSKELFKLTKKMIKQHTSENDSILFNFAMGKLCDNLKMFKKSFEYYRFGNMLKRAQVEFNIDSHVDYLSRIKETFSADFIENRKSWDSDSEMPIFIFGMPRSGTTLVEQIIASHPNVYGGGEIQFFNQVDQNIPSILKVNERYPECLNFINDQTAHHIVELYIKETRELVGLSKDYTRITDKNPFNFFHLGLISLLFPKASFIHCQRYPLDTCISIYTTIFLTGNHYAYDLSELGQYYLEYLKLMNHWRKVLPIRIFELRYEDIVQQQQEVSQKLLEFCRLEWNSACLDFYKNDRPVFTASDWQVRQPIYTTSCGRWQNYDQFLNPLKELLADFI